MRGDAPCMLNGRGGGNTPGHRRFCGSSDVLPGLQDVPTGFVEVDVLIDVIDPRNHDQMMMPAVRSVLGELYLVAPLHVVNGSNALSVRCDNVHMLFDF